MSRRVFSIAILPFLLAVAPPSPSPSLGPADDHVFALIGTSTCRTMFGSIVHHVGRRDGDLLDVTGTVQPPNAKAYPVDDRYTLDRAAGTWHVRLGAGTSATGEGTAPPWTGPKWEVVTHDAQGSERIHYELLADGDLRRTIEQTMPGFSSIWRPVDAELCAPGDAPPPADACVAENFPAYSTSYGTPIVRVGPGPSGVVRVVVSLDARSQIVSMRIQSTPLASYNQYALETVRLSTFQTQIRNCKPIAADYIFSVSFGS
jgi:hypothetical protein